MSLEGQVTLLQMAIPEGVTGVAIRKSADVDL
jgi:hypothetical protein